MGSGSQRFRAVFGQDAWHTYPGDIAAAPNRTTAPEKLLRGGRLSLRANDGKLVLLVLFLLGQLGLDRQRPSTRDAAGISNSIVRDEELPGAIGIATVERG